MTAIDVFCGGCGAQGTVNKVTAGLQCRCGSVNLGLVGVDELSERTANRWNANDPTGGGYAQQSQYNSGVGSENGNKDIRSEAEVLDQLHNRLTVRQLGEVLNGTSDHGLKVREHAILQKHYKVGPYKEGSQHVAAPHGPGTGWGQPQELTRGWSSYEGPQPGVNPLTGAPVADDLTCPTCHGAGYDAKDKAICRECGGSGKVSPTTGKPAVESYDTHAGPPVGGARHATARPVSGSVQVVSGRPSKADPFGTAEYQNQHGGGGYSWEGPSGAFNPADERTFYPKYEGQSPAVHTRQQPNYDAPPTGHHQLNEAYCPECGHGPTELRLTREDKFGNQDAVWHCPNCGPLVNIDKHPEIDPYHPEETGYAGPDRGALKTGRLLRRQAAHSGKVLSMLASIEAANSGISRAQALTLVRKALAAYPEGRS